MSHLCDTSIFADSGTDFLHLYDLRFQGPFFGVLGDFSELVSCMTRPGCDFGVHFLGFWETLLSLYDQARVRF